MCNFIVALPGGEEMTDRIERELELPASPARVWESLTDPELLAGWLADEVSLDLRPGGEATFRICELVRSGWIEEVRPPGRSSQDDGEQNGRLPVWGAQDGGPAARVR